MPQPIVTRSDWLASHPPKSDRLGRTLAELGRLGGSDADFQHGVREFLDEFALRADDDSRLAAVAEEPPVTGELRRDAYLGALAEHLATVHRFERPAWSVAPSRFLDRFWFVSDVRGFRAISIAQAPAAFRRRGIFIPERSLHRV
jgi:hypothetical protein